LRSPKNQNKDLLPLKVTLDPSSFSTSLELLEFYESLRELMELSFGGEIEKIEDGEG
jgi:hypothetical protein